MAGPGADIPFDLLCQRYRIDRAHAEHVARLSGELFARLGHLHGLTKTSARLVAAAALLHDIAQADGKRDHHLRGRARLESLPLPPLDKTQRRIVAEAVGLHAKRARLGPVLRPLGADPEGAALGVAARIAALLRIADGLDHSRTQTTRIAGLADDGQTVELVVTGGPTAGEDASAALVKADLFSRLAPRPVRMVRVLGNGERPPRPAVTPNLPLAEVARRVFQDHLATLTSRAYALPYRDDPEVVHEMRVATRRLRAAMRLFRRTLDGDVERFRAEIKRVADVLGEARDEDVFRAFLDAQAARAPDDEAALLKGLQRSVARRRRAAYDRVLALVDSDAYRGVTRDLARALKEPVGALGGLVPGRRADRPLWREGRRALRRALARVLGYGRKLQRLSPDELHALRIGCKRVRYTAEALLDVYPAGLADLARTMRAMQDALGDAHDADVYRERIEAYLARRSGGAEEAAALLRSLARRKRARVKRATALWKDFTSARNRKRVARLVGRPRKS